MLPNQTPHKDYLPPGDRRIIFTIIVGLVVWALISLLMQGCKEGIVNAPTPEGSPENNTQLPTPNPSTDEEAVEIVSLSGQVKLHARIMDADFRVSVEGVDGVADCAKVTVQYVIVNFTKTWGAGCPKAQASKSPSPPPAAAPPAATADTSN